MYTRVFASILDSSLMDTSIEARWLFLAMLIIGDEARTGVVDMPITRLAARAALTVEQRADLTDPRAYLGAAETFRRRLLDRKG